MRHPHVSSLLVPALAFLAVLAGSGARTPATAADCGDGVGPCSCGDRVITNTTLDDTDPVTTSVCPCDGLIVRSGVTLNLGGHTITGSGVCVGANIGPEGFGSFNASVGGGRITRFGIGVLASIEGGQTRLHGLQVVENSHGGALLSGFGNVVEDCIVSRNGGRGIELSTGNDPPGGGVVQRCRVEDNHGQGIVAGFRGTVIKSNIVRRNTGPGIDAGGGGGNTVTLNRVEGNGQGLIVSSTALEFGPSSVTRNVVLRNLAAGVKIGGVGVLVDRNQSKYNGGEGFTIEGEGHTVTLNTSLGNGEDGFTVDAEGSRFERNISSYNRGYGILDAHVGMPNAYVNNRCTGNALGKSSPPGLCF